MGRGLQTPLLFILFIMVKKIVQIAVVTEVFAVVVGCSENGVSPDSIVSQAGCVITNASPLFWEDLKPENVVVRIGDRVLTRSDVDFKLWTVRESLFRSVRSRKEAEKKWPEVERAFPGQYISRYICSCAFALEAQERGVVASEEDLKVAREQHGMMISVTGLKEDEFFARFPGGKVRFERNVLDDARNRAYFREMFAKDLEVSEEDVKTVKNLLTKANADTAKSNQLIRARLEGLAGKFSGKNIPFTDDSDHNAKFLPEDCEVEILDNAPKTVFEDEESVQAAIRAVPLGSWTKPVEFEDTFDVYCITNAIKGERNVPNLYSGFHLSIRKDLGYIVPDEDTIRRNLRESKNVSVVMPEAERLTAKFGAVYPYGFVWNRVRPAKSVRKVGRIK